jgi:hypothetical protein
MQKTAENEPEDLGDDTPWEKPNDNLSATADIIPLNIADQKYYHRFREIIDEIFEYYFKQFGEITTEELEIQLWPGEEMPLGMQQILQGIIQNKLSNNLIIEIQPGIYKKGSGEIVIAPKKPVEILGDTDRGLTVRELELSFRSIRKNGHNNRRHNRTPKKYQR